MKYTPAQIERYRRQKRISVIEKTLKNLYRLFRDDNCDIGSFGEAFGRLMERYEGVERVRLGASSPSESEKYIDWLREKMERREIEESEFDEFRLEQLGRLNRLQKLKNGTSYKKAKHRDSFSSDGW